MKHTNWRFSILQRLRDQMALRKVDGLVVTSLSDIRYLTGFTGSNALAFVTAKSQFLLTDVRYDLQAPAETTNWDILISRESTLIETLANYNLAKKCNRIGFNERQITVVQHSNLRSVLRPASFVKTGALISALREIKAKEELASHRAAARMADTVWAEVLERIKPGMEEQEIAAEISYRAALSGSEADPFSPIVVSGPRSALIHGKPSARKIRRGDLVIVDFGCTVNGYCSDMTRTFGVGGLSKEKKTMYETVRSVQEETIAKARGGITGKALDDFARSGIRNAGYGKYFTHALGHGLGLDVHEGPRVSTKATEALQIGHVITIEPGIYIPNVGGVRIEDDMVIKKAGVEMLTNSPKELIII